MIIEFTGLPGSGKSTIFRLLQTKIKNKRCIFDIQKYFLGKFNNKIVFDFFLMFNFFKLTKEDLKFLKEIIYIIKSSDNTFFNKLNIFRNCYKKIIIYKLLKNKKEIFFIDEGMFHIPLSLFVDSSSKKINKDQISKLFNFFLVSDIIFIIDAPDDLLLERVIKRGRKGHRRMQFNKKESVINFMKKSRVVLEILKEEMKKRNIENFYEYQNVGNINFQKILKLLKVKECLS